MSVKVGIVGGAGYTAGELLRLLVNHSEVIMDFVYSTSNAGNKIGKVHQDLIGQNLTFSGEVNTNVDVVFLCLGHGHSKSFLENHHFSGATKIIDLSNDFRLQPDAQFMGREFVYGLPELQKAKIKKANNIANPGCFATAIQLALLPLTANNLVKDAIHIQAVTGATGAGISLSGATHFAWRDNNFSYYKPFTHQHLGEIEQSLKQLQKGFKHDVNFMPYRGNFSRGIFATAYTQFDGTLEQAKELYKEYYRQAIFTLVSDEPLHLKQVVNTNHCFVHLHKHQDKLLVTSVIDNLLKGASGQAIENMNLMFGFFENEGLQLKANYF